MSRLEAQLQKEESYEPTITDMISLEFLFEVKVSPDGRKIAYSVRTTNWRENCYEMQCYIHDIHQGRSFQLTRTGNVLQLDWIDDNSLAVLKSNEKEKAQIWIFEHLIGEGLKITDHKTDIQLFRPFAGGILFLANNPKREEKESRTEKFGTFTHFEEEESASALYYISLEKIKEYHEQLKQHTEGKAKRLVEPVLELSKRLDKPLKIVDFVVSPLNDAVYLNCRSKDALVFFEKTSSYRIGLDPEEALEELMNREQSTNTEDGAEEPSKDDISRDEEDLSYLGELTKISLPKGATISAVSPDGTKLLIRHKERDNLYYTRADLWVLDLVQCEDKLEDEELEHYMENISSPLDREVGAVHWVKSGVFVSYVDGTKTKIAKLTEYGEIHALDFQGIFPMSLQFHISKDGLMGFVGTDETTYPEIFISCKSPPSSRWETKQLTSYGHQVAGWNLGTVETIQWTSKDGTEIEGVLRKPANFEPAQKYPLVFVVHGGPRSYSPAYLLAREDLSYYPTVQFNHKDVLVLKPNYRGSRGRGQAFMELNKNNLGVGDLWDLEGAIDYLDSQGYIDKSRVGCMGWSQGGYISAFAGIHSHEFRAVSVGAGVSDWYTYHIGNDIPHFTTHYLSGTPFKNRELYIKTAPMSKIQQAKTPTLIQHGAKDQRVPLVSATELYRGLKDMNVPVELFVYPEMAHPITKPRENRTVMQQNLAWFSHYLLGKKLDFYQEV